MRNLLRPTWLLLVTILPLGLLALLGGGEFGVIKTLLPPASVLLWQRLALALGGLALGTLGYAGWAWRRGRAVSAGYAGAALLAYGAFLGVYSWHSAEVLPREVPRWLVPTDMLVYVWTFLMPTLAHALLVLVVRATPAGRPHSAWLNFGLAAAVPLGGLLVMGLLDGLQVERWLSGLQVERWLHEAILTVLALAAVTVSPVVFLFFLTRGVYILTLRREAKALGLLLKIVVALVLPLLGLAVNNGLFWGRGLTTGTGIFGNFSSPWFYGLAVLNALLLCWPDPARPAGRLALLVGRSALLGYTGYFFLVFLPWLPLSVVAVMAIGTGFLMLAPLVLLVVHLRALADDVAALRAAYPRWVPRAALLGGAAVLPLLLTATYYHDRRVLHAALAYAYAPDFTQTYALDAAALGRTLAVVRQQKASSRDFFMGNQQPYLSMYFNWLVLDNLTLSEEKITTLERIFGLGAPGPETGRGWLPPDPPTTPTLRALTGRSRYDARQQAWVSWVDLEVANPDPTQRAAEYAATFELPPGCWVGEYYLDQNGHREPGILAEKKAADWVYAQIVHQNDRRDPGLLTYLGPGRLRLKVYPVMGAAPRRTGFQLLHREPLALTIGGRALALGRPTPAAPPSPVATPDGAVVYLSAADQQRLPLVQRRPYYHFLLDVSAGRAERKAADARRVAGFLRAHTAVDMAPPRFTLVNSYATPVPAGADWRAALAQFPNAGGCYLTGAVQRVLAEAWQHPAPTYPVLVVVTDSLARTVLAPDFAAFAPAYPEGGQWLLLKPDGQAEPHALAQAAAQALPPAALPRPAVRAWPTAAHARAYLPAAAAPAVVLSQPAAPLAAPAAAAPRWLAGLALAGFAQYQALHPAAADARHLAFIQASFRHRILAPGTSFLALENEAQKAALRRKQSQTLAANANLDAQEAPPEAATAVPLDDYAPWLLLLGLGLGWRRLRREVAVGQ